MNDEYVTRAECLEHQKVTNAERENLVEANKRQDARLKKLEETVETIHDLAISVNTLATNMQHMLDELKNQGDRLTTLEKKDGDMWRNLLKGLVTGVAMLAIGYIFGTLTGTGG